MSRDAYGRTPLDPDYAKDTLPPAGRDPLSRFNGEFAQLVGPKRRGHGFNEPDEDSDGMHDDPSHNREVELTTAGQNVGSPGVVSDRLAVLPTEVVNG